MILDEITPPDGQLLPSGTTDRKEGLCFVSPWSWPHTAEREAEEQPLSWRHCPCVTQVLYDFKIVRTSNSTVSFVSPLSNVSNAISADSGFVLQSLWNLFFIPPPFHSPFFPPSSGQSLPSLPPLPSASSSPFPPFFLFSLLYRLHFLLFELQHKLINFKD